MNGLAPDLRSKVEIHFSDATAGLVLELLNKALDIVARSEAAEEALPQLVPLFKGETASTSQALSAPDGWKASYVVSSGLSSQATILPERAVIRAYREKFGVELEDGYFFKRGSFQLRNDWVRLHGELLASLVLPGGRVYWADTVSRNALHGRIRQHPLGRSAGWRREIPRTVLSEHLPQRSRKRGSRGEVRRQPDVAILLQS